MVNIYYFQLDNKVKEGHRNVFMITLTNTNPSFDDITGFKYTGIITKIIPMSFSMNTLKSKSIFKIGNEINIFDLKVLKENELAIRTRNDDLHIINDYKFLLNTLFKKKINFEVHKSQNSAIFFNCNNKSSIKPSSKYYKIHISIEIKHIFLVIFKLFELLCKYQDIFQEGKIIMPFFQHYFDIKNIQAQKYLKWNNGSAVANIVLYPFETYDKEPLKFQKRLIDFIIDWGENDKYGRHLNNLQFNERISKSIYFAYGSDSSDKTNELEKGVIKNYKISNNLKKEKRILCTEEQIKNKYKYLNDCLLNKYNITYEQLCENKLNNKDVWTPLDMLNNNEISFNDECYKK